MRSRVVVLTIVVLMTLIVASTLIPKAETKKRTNFLLKIFPFLKRSKTTNEQVMQKPSSKHGTSSLMRKFLSFFKRSKTSNSKKKPQIVVNGRDLLKMKIRWRQHVVPGIHHWAYALSKDGIFHIVPPDMNSTVVVPEMRMLDEYDYGELSNAGPNPRKAPLLNDGSIALAHRLMGLVLYYNYLRCNCRHYVDYIVYGRTFGWMWNPNMNSWSINKRCPLHRRITPDTDLDYGDFQLQDGHGNLYPINPMPD